MTQLLRVIIEILILGITAPRTLRCRVVWSEGPKSTMDGGLLDGAREKEKPSSLVSTWPVWILGD